MAEDWNTLNGNAHFFLEPTYDMVEIFLENIVQGSQLSELDEAVHLTSVDWSSDWNQFAEHYHGYLTVVAVSLALLLSLIVGGAIFCCCRCCPCFRDCYCCRCCCCCPNPSGKRNRSGRLSRGQLCCALLLFILLGAMTMGLAIMLVSNPLLDAEVQGRKIYQNLDQTVHEAQEFIDETMEEVSNTALETYNLVQNDVLQALYNIPELGMEDLEASTGFMFLLEEQRKIFWSISETCEQIDQTTDQLKDDAIFLNSELENLQTTILGLFPNCISLPTCRGGLEALRLAVNYSGLVHFSDVSEAADLVENSVLQAQQQLESIEDDIEGQLQKAVQSVEDALKAGSKSLSDFLDEATAKSDLGLASKVEDLDENEVREAFEKYWDVWFLSMICLSVGLSLVALALLLGLGCGLCGKAAGAARVCNRSRAPCILMTSVYLLLVFCILVVAISLVLFLVGGVIHTEACRYFEDPAHYKTSLDTIDKIIVNKTSISIYVMSAVTSCGDGHVLYTALGLDDLNGKNLNKTLDPLSYGIPKALGDVADVNVTIGEVILVTEATIAYMGLVNETLRAKDLVAYVDTMTSAVMDEELGDIADRLEQFANQSKNETHFIERTDRLRMLNSHLGGMEDRQQMVLNEISLLENITEAVQEVLEELDSAEDTLNLAGNDLLGLTASTVTSQAVEAIYLAVTDLAYRIRHQVGECGPLHSMAYSFLSYVCVDVIYPLNAFWFGMGCFLTFALIAMFTSCALASAFTPNDYIESAHHITGSKPFGTYAPSCDLYGNDSKSLQLPDGAVQARDYSMDYQNAILVSYVGKCDSNNMPSWRGTMKTNVSESADRDRDDFTTFSW